MTRRWIWLAAAGAATLATAALAQDEAAFRAQMIARCGTIADAVAATACVAAANRGPAPAAVVAGPPGAPEPETPRAPALAPAPVPAAPASPASGPAIAAAQDGFGAEQVKGRRPARTTPNEVTAAAAAASDDGRGYWTITLDTGARWRMTEAAPNFRPPKPGEPVRIKKGAIGGYMMSVGSQANVRVTRVD